MRIICPLCGERDRREFDYLGDAAALARPEPDAPAEAWHDYIHLRENPAGRRRELWYHALGCAAWLVVTRDSSTHEIFAVAPADEEGRRR